MVSWVAPSVNCRADAGPPEVNIASRPIRRTFSNEHTIFPSKRKPGRKLISKERVATRKVPELVLYIENPKTKSTPPAWVGGPYQAPMRPFWADPQKGLTLLSSFRRIGNRSGIPYIQLRTNERSE